MPSIKFNNAYKPLIPLHAETAAADVSALSEMAMHRMKPNYIPPNTGRFNAPAAT